MKTRDDSKSLSGLILMGDAYWGGKKREGKRGRGASGKIPFIAALKISPQGHPHKKSLLDGLVKSQRMAK